jgi:predicted RNase H-like nuclease (RuvC/YqgF family)
MNPKEKADELVKKMYKAHSNSASLITLYFAKQCALIAVDEIFEFMKMDDEYTETLSNANSKWVGYWQEVKQEIEKIGDDNE